jgi:hypothetical protein
VQEASRWLSESALIPAQVAFPTKLYSSPCQGVVYFEKFYLKNGDLQIPFFSVRRRLNIRALRKPSPPSHLEAIPVPW